MEQNADNSCLEQCHIKKIEVNKKLIPYNANIHIIIEIDGQDSQSGYNPSLLKTYLHATFHSVLDGLAGRVDPSIKVYD